MLPLPQGPPLEHLFSWCFVSGFCHICSSFSVLFWVNRKVQLAGVADCFDFCAICYLHLNLQIFCGQTNWTARGVRSPEDLHFVLGAFILGSVCLTQMRVRGTEAESSDKCTNLVLRAWPSCQYLHNVRLSFIFFYFFTVAPLTSPPAAALCFFKLFGVCLNLIACLYLPGTKCFDWWLDSTRGTYHIVRFGSPFFFLGEVSRCPSSISFVCAPHKFCRTSLMPRLIPSEAEALCIYICVCRLTFDVHRICLTVVFPLPECLPLVSAFAIKAIDLRTQNLAGASHEAHKTHWISFCSKVSN